MKSPRNPTAAGLALTLALATAPAWATVEPQGPNETVCPNPALTSFDRESADHVWPALTGTPLAPGGSVLTLGTNPSESPELSDEVLRSFARSFSFNTAQGIVSGTVLQLIKRGTDHRCKAEWQITVSPESLGCVTAIRIDGFLHPLDKPLVADYRDDLPGDTNPDRAYRSAGDGSKLRFRVPGGVCAGKTSRPLLLNTSINKMARKGSLQLQGPAGELSPPVSTYVPK